MKKEHLQTKMQARFRQHVSRVHGMKARDKDAAKLRDFGKQLICPFLHTRERSASSSSEAKVSVSCVLHTLGWNGQGWGLEGQGLGLTFDNSMY